MCPPCKILLDDPGRLAASANLLADVLGPAHALYPTARYLAASVAASGAAILRAIDMGILSEADIDKAHAFSELNCHRAAQLRKWAGWRGSKAKIIGNPDGNVARTALLLMELWADEDSDFTTALIGGEYDGGWIVDGTTGIRRKEAAE